MTHCGVPSAEVTSPLSPAKDRRGAGLSAATRRWDKDEAFLFRFLNTMGAVDVDASACRSAISTTLLFLRSVGGSRELKGALEVGRLSFALLIALIKSASGQ